MNVKRKSLKESIISDPEKGQPDWDRLVEKASNYLYFRKYLKLLKEAQGTLQGDITDESDATSALGEVYNQIVMGIEEHIPLNFARIFRTTKSEIKVPVGTYGVATEISTGAFTAAPKTTSPVTVAIDKEYGVDVSWTRAHLE